MADFTGMSVRVVLKQPPGEVVEGRVKQILPGQALTLQEVYFPQQGRRVAHCDIPGWGIADIQVVNTSSTPGPASSDAATRPPDFTAPQSILLSSSVPAAAVPDTADAQSQRQTSDFVDPAILSYGRSPAPKGSTSRPRESATPVKSILPKAAEVPPSNASPFVGEASKSRGSDKMLRAEETSRPPTMVNGVTGIATVDSRPNKKASKRADKKHKNISADSNPPPVMNTGVSRNGNDMNGSVKRGKGWRQTPLLETSSNHGRSQQRKPRRQEDSSQAQNGWATEEATDIQDLGDFDFEANHKLFDKKQVFDELRQGDTTADEDRLVGHNRIHRPGTYGGKNLHPTENVLSPKLEPAVDSTSDADTELNFTAARSSSRHSTSRSVLKKQPSRQNSSHLESRQHPLSASMSSLRSSITHASKAPKVVTPIVASPMADRTRSPMSAISASKSQKGSLPPSFRSEPRFSIRSTGLTCPVLLPSALETLEDMTISRFGLSSDAITESAARCIAEMAVDVVGQVAPSRRSSRTNTRRGSTSLGLPSDRSLQSVVVILAGNHSIGARAVAAARHLVCRGMKVILAEAQVTSTTSPQHPQLQAQLSVLRRMIKTGANVKRGPWRRANGYIKTLSAPPTLIIDALSAGDSPLSPALDGDPPIAPETREMIDWANRSRAPVLSLACPAGVSGVDGSAPVVEGEPLAIRPERILCLGAPVQGLLRAMSEGEKWDVWLADIGINITLRSEDAVRFGREWVVELRCVERETGEREESCAS